MTAHLTAKKRPDTGRVAATRRRTLGACLGAALLAACAGEPTIQTGDNAETIMGGTLARVDNARAELVYVDPDADYARYQRVLIVPLDVDNIEIVQPGTSTSAVNRYNREWQLEDKDKQWLRETFRSAMETAITSGGAFGLATEGGDDVLRIEAMITRIAPSGPKDDLQSRPSARTRVYTEGAGAMSIAVMLADGDSGEIIALIKDTRSSQSATWGMNNSVSNQAEVRRTFNTWGTRIHDGLLALRARSEAAR